MWQKAGILHGFLEVPISQHATTCNHFSQKVDKKICLEGIEISSLFDFTCLMVLPNKRGTFVKYLKGMSQKIHSFVALHSILPILLQKFNDYLKYFVDNNI